MILEAVGPLTTALLLVAATWLRVTWVDVTGKVTDVTPPELAGTVWGCPVDGLTRTKCICPFSVFTKRCWLPGAPGMTWKEKRKFIEVCWIHWHVAIGRATYWLTLILNIFLVVAITSKLNVTSKCANLPIFKLHWIWAIANLFAHNNITNSNLLLRSNFISYSAAINYIFLTIWHLWSNIYFAGDCTWN